MFSRETRTLSFWVLLTRNVSNQHSRAKSESKCKRTRKGETQRPSGANAMNVTVGKSRRIQMMQQN